MSDKYFFCQKQTNLAFFLFSGFANHFAGSYFIADIWCVIPRRARRSKWSRGSGIMFLFPPTALHAIKIGALTCSNYFFGSIAAVPVQGHL